MIIFPGYYPSLRDFVNKRQIIFSSGIIIISDHFDIGNVTGELFSSSELQNNVAVCSQVNPSDPC